MVTFKVDADALVKGMGKDGALGVQVSGVEGSPISARISGDSRSPIVVGPIEVAPITIIPDLELVAKTIDFGALISAFTKLSQGVKVEVANSGAPLSIALGKIPVDLTISVSSPASEMVFKVEIKGTVGEK